MVDSSDWTAARDRFMAQRTGTTHDDPNMELLLSAIIHIPAVMETANGLNGGWTPGTLEHWARNTPVAKYAFDYAGQALNVATDGLTGIYAEIVLALAMPNFALLTLARQVSESALRARWLLDDLTPNGLVTRGYAVAWQEAATQRTFTHQAIDYGLITSKDEPAARQKVSDRSAELTVDGRAHRLLKRKDGKELPIVTMPVMTELFRDIRNGPVGPSGNQDMRWLYSLLSGVAHGRTWAAIHASIPTIVQEYLNYTDDGIKPSGTVLARSDPSTMNIVLAIQVGLLNTLDAIGCFQRARQLTAPAS